jgi:transposase
MAAGNLGLLKQEITKAKTRFGLPADAPVRSCYEAGRDGFWLHRHLTQEGIQNVVVDAASIEVNRRARRAKSDRLDVGKLLQMLLRYHGGEPKVWSVVRVPTVADEDRRQLHRELLELKAERTQHTNRMQGLLACYGVEMPALKADFPQALAEVRQWDGTPVPQELQQRLVREAQRLEMLEKQIRALERERLARLRHSSEPAVEQARKLLSLRGIGINSAWLFSMELFGWRRIQNRRQVGALAGLVPTPYQSGDHAGEQGISKAGNRRLRTMAVEIAWCWLHYQPQSAWSQWYGKRFARGNKRLRRIGIVALARKLLVGLWRYLEEGVVPDGAVLVDWRAKLNKHQVTL